MMVLNHSVGSVNVRLFFTWIMEGFRGESLLKQCSRAWCFACITAKSRRFGLGALHSDCSQLASELQGVPISVEACANA